MKLPKNYFENLSINKYREYLKLLPEKKRKNTKVITMLIFTFFALSFLGLFAINPTITTIIELQKQLEESEFVYEQLTTKMNNLTNLQQQYSTLTDDLPFVYEAIPQTASVTTLVGQISAIADRETVQITTIRISPVILSDTKSPQGIKTHSSFTFILEAEGDYDNLMNFAKALTYFNRIVTIESIALTKDATTGQLILTMEGRQYFKNETK